MLSGRVRTHENSIFNAINSVVPPSQNPPSTACVEKRRVTGKNNALLDEEYIVVNMLL